MTVCVCMCVCACVCAYNLALSSHVSRLTSHVSHRLSPTVLPRPFHLSPPTFHLSHLFPPTTHPQAFAAASSASDRACIASDGEIAVPFSAQDVCFNAESSGCNGGTLYTPWSFIQSTGVVTGGQTAYDVASPKSDPFDDMRTDLCASFSMPHCFHHGPENTSPYPAEGDEGCPSQTSPAGPLTCDDNSTIASFEDDKYVR